MLTSLPSLQQGNVKKSKKSMKIVNIEAENLHIFCTTRRISAKFSGKMWLMIILKITKNQGFTLSLENIFSKKSKGVKLNPTTLIRVNDFWHMIDQFSNGFSFPHELAFLLFA